MSTTFRLGRLWLAFIGWFLLGTAGAELTFGAARDRLSRMRVCS
jgi:hypothetical protein